jgi:nucleoside-diphosphate-sugar epimerase
MKPTVLITGDRGFIGSHVKQLLKDDYQIQTITEDLFTADIKGYLQTIKADYLIHLAWETKAGYLTSEKNLLWMQKSIEIFHYFYLYGGKRAVFIGTEQEYQASDSFHTEEDCLLPQSIYAKSKAYLGELLSSYSKENNLGFVWCRLFFVFGEGEKPARLMPSIIKALLKNETIQCSWEGTVRDYLYVKDVASAILCCLFSDYTGIVNICGGKATTIGEIARIIESQIGGEGKVLFKSKEETNPPLVIKGDNGLLKSLGWKPQYTLEEGIALEIAYLKDMFEH